MALDTRHPLAWTLAAGLVGLAVSGIVSGLLGWSRVAFVAVHAAAVCLLATAYVRATRLSIGIQLGRRWVAGLISGVLLGALLVRSGIAQPGSAAPEGWALIGDLAWLGLVHGSADAVLLTILPVLAIYGSRHAALARPLPRLGWAMAALGGSLAVTAAYHLGFVELRGGALLASLLGNGLITLGYLLTGSPLTPLVAHVAMHAAAVLPAP